MDAGQQLGCGLRVRIRDTTSQRTLLCPVLTSQSTPQMSTSPSWKQHRRVCGDYLSSSVQETVSHDHCFVQTCALAGSAEPMAHILTRHLSAAAVQSVIMHRSHSERESSRASGLNPDLVRCLRSGGCRIGARTVTSAGFDDRAQARYRQERDGAIGPSETSCLHASTSHSYSSGDIFRAWPGVPVLVLRHRFKRVHYKTACDINAHG
jgi:hypothetical protein